MGHVPGIQVPVSLRGLHDIMRALNMGAHSIRIDREDDGEMTVFYDVERSVRAAEYEGELPVELYRGVVDALDTFFDAYAFDGGSLCWGSVIENIRNGDDYDAEFGDGSFARACELADKYELVAWHIDVITERLLSLARNGVFREDTAVFTFDVDRSERDPWLYAMTRRYSPLRGSGSNNLFHVRVSVEVSGLRGLPRTIGWEMAKHELARRVYWFLRERKQGAVATLACDGSWRARVLFTECVVQSSYDYLTSGFAPIAVAPLPVCFDELVEFLGHRLVAAVDWDGDTRKLALVNRLLGEVQTTNQVLVYSDEPFDGIVCGMCGELHTRDDFSRIDGLWVDTGNMSFICSECLESSAVCALCGRRRYVSDMEDVLLDGRLVCSHGDGECRGAESLTVVECECCGESYISEIDDMHYDVNGDRVCDACIDEHYVCCDNCGEYVRRDDAHEVDCEWYCDECYPNVVSGRIMGYSYKPSPVFLGVPALPDRELYFGLEIETDCGDTNDFVSDCGSLFFPDMYYKHDGSLDEGVECVTHPMSYDYALAFDWDRFHRIAVRHGMRSHDTTTCGFHIHVSRDGLGRSWAERELTAAKLVMFFDHYRSDLLSFSRRRRASADEWARSNDADIKAGDTREEACKKAKDSSEYSRYCAVNLQNSATVEIRLWRGTTNPATIRSTIDMTHAIVRYCMDTELRELCEPASLWDCVGGLIRDETKGYMTLRGLNPEADTPRVDGCED